MSDADALKIAIDLFFLPSQVRATRTRPLPKGTKFLLLIAAGDTDAMRNAQGLSNRSSTAIREAAIFFVEQILLERGADAYRTLGLDQNAPTTELRTHMALLIKWLHPDLNSDERRSTMARQVIRAWKQVNAPDNARRPPLSSTRHSTTTTQRRIENFAAVKRGTAYTVLPAVSRTHRFACLLKLIIVMARRRAVHWRT